MAKAVHNDVLDAALDVIRDNCNLMIACSAQPATRAEAVVTHAPADVDMTSGNFVKAEGDASGRKLTVAAKATVPVDAPGDATHIALVDSTRLLYVTTCTLKGLTVGNTADFPAWDIEIADPT